LKELPLVIIKHPLGGIEAKDVQEKADVSIDLVIRALAG